MASLRLPKNHYEMRNVFLPQLPRKSRQLLSTPLMRVSVQANVSTPDTPLICVFGPTDGVRRKQIRSKETKIRRNSL